MSAMKCDVSGASLQTKAKLYDHGLECVDERADPSAMMSAFYMFRPCQAKPRQRLRYNRSIPSIESWHDDRRISAMLCAMVAGAAVMPIGGDTAPPELLMNSRSEPSRGRPRQSEAERR